MKLFVYGTLKKGRGLNSLLDSSKFLGNCYTEGKMYISTLYCVPYLTREKGRVYGELYEVSDNEVINTIRGIERGYSEEDTLVTLENGDRVKARAYFGIHIEYMLKDGNYVVSEDF